MFETAFTLGLTQFARTFSIPERIQHRPARNAALELLRLRNTGFDAMFYDVKALTAEETFYISDSLGSEGLIIIVPPTGGGMLTLCDSIEEYRLRGGRDVHALAVAGIGGSALGAAAFARNVADSIGAPVVAVVSGYGLGDILNEAIGGAFFFGWLGQMRNSLEAIDDAVGRPKLGAYAKREKNAHEPGRTGLDADTVETLLSDPALSFTLLTGHSRGNRVIADALYAMKTSSPAALKTLTTSSRIVTFGGRIKMPEVFTDVIDVVGELDWYGEINSRPKIESDVRVPFCGHSTNTDLAGALQVTTILKDILAKGPEVKEPEFKGPENTGPKIKEPKIKKLEAAPAVMALPVPVIEAKTEEKPAAQTSEAIDAETVKAATVEIAEAPAKLAPPEKLEAPAKPEARLSETASVIVEASPAPQIPLKKSPAKESAAEPETTPALSAAKPELAPPTVKAKPSASQPLASKSPVAQPSAAKSPAAKPSAPKAQAAKAAAPKAQDKVTSVAEADSRKPKAQARKGRS